MREKQKPVTTVVGHDVFGNTEEHPAYALISASRVSATPGVFLNGTPFAHRTYIEVRIKRSVMMRTLSRDWNSAKEEIVSVMLSESQWASFISSMNIGEGVPCTFDRINGAPIPGIEAPVPKTERFLGEMNEDFQKALDSLKELNELVASSVIPAKMKRVIWEKINHATNMINGGAKFVPKQFEEHMAESVDQAKSEAAAYLMAAIQKAGISSLSDGNVQEKIEYSEE
jgi:hypothetical protein